MPIELIPYSQNITPLSHMICCVVKKFDSKSTQEITDERDFFQSLKVEGWQIEFVIANTLSNIGRMMRPDQSYSEKTLSKNGVWNLFVRFRIYDTYLGLVKRSDQSLSEYQL